MSDLISREAALAILAPAANSRGGLWARRRRGPAMTHSDTDPAVNPEPRLPVNSPGLTAGGFSPVAE